MNEKRKMKIVRRGDVVYVVPDDGANENGTNGPVFTLRAKIDGKDSVIEIEPSELDALLEQLADYRAKKNGETDEVIVRRATEIAIETGKISTALLQRKLRIGYGRAASLIDELEKRGIIGPARGDNGPREVLLKNISELD